MHDEVALNITLGLQATLACRVLLPARGMVACRPRPPPGVDHKPKLHCIRSAPVSCLQKKLSEGKVYVAVYICINDIIYILYVDEDHVYI